MFGEVSAIHRETEDKGRAAVVELDRASHRREKAPQFTIGSQPELEREITNALSLIRSSAKTIGDLRRQILEQDDAIKDLSKENAELKRQSKSETENFIALERDLALERERLERAERQVATLDSQLRRLEEYGTLLQQNVSKITNCVQESFVSVVNASASRLTA